MLLGMLAVSSFAYAWPNNPGFNLPVCTAAHEQKTPQLISDDAGGAIVTWSDYRNGTNGDVYAQHVLVGGVADPMWPADGRAVCTAVGDQRNQTVASDHAGGAIVAWVDTRDGYFAIYAQHVSAGGTVDPAWPSDGRALCLALPARSLANPKIVADGAGGAIAVWWGYVNGTYNYLYAQHLLASGLVDPGWPADGLVISTNAVAFSMGSDGAHGAIVAWDDERSGFGVIYAQHILIGGLDPAWPSDGRRLTVSTYRQHAPTIAPDGAGGAIATWIDYRSDVADIYGQHVLADGTVDSNWPSNGIPICTAVRQQYNPEIVADGTGGAIIAWDDYRDTNNGDIYAQHVLASATVDPAWQANGTPICTAAGTQSSAVLVSDGSAGAIVAWADGRGDGDIYAQHVLSIGSVDPNWPADGRPISTALMNQSQQAIVSDGAGGGILSWEDLRTRTTPDIYAQRVNRSGDLGSFTFVPSSTSVGPSAPVSMPIDDLNRDGIPDIVVVSDAGNDIWVYLGSSGGSFEPPVRYAVGSQPNQAIIADLNGDGFLDIATASSDGASTSDGTVTLLFGNGSGAFPTRVDLPVINPIYGHAPVDAVLSITSSDFNGDGHLDLAVGTSSGVVILLNDGSGGFTQLVDSAQNLGSWTIAATDLNRDGRQDLVFHNANYGIETQLGNGDGTFQSPRDFYVAPQGIPSLAIGDLNEDGFPDVVYAPAYRSAGDITVLLGNGDGSLRLADSPFYLASGAVRPLLIDLNGDSHLDLVVPRPDGSGVVSLFQGDGHGAFRDAGLLSVGAAAINARDLDGDGRPDLACGVFGTSPQLQTLRNVTDYLVVNHPPTADAKGPYNGLVWVPIQFDGSASSDPDGGLLTYLWDFGDGGNNTEGVKPAHAYQAVGSYTVTLTVLDDGSPTLTGTATTTATIVAAQPPAPLGTLLTTVTCAMTGDNLGRSVAAIGDFNGDGYGDFIVGANGHNNGKGAAYIFFGGPTAHNVPDLTLSEDAPGGAFGWSVAGAGDVNGDGYADVVVGAYSGAFGSGRAFVYYGGPNPDTIPDLTLTAGISDFGWAVSGAGDVNGDGYADVIVGALSRGAYVYYGGPTANGLPDLTLSGIANFGVSVTGGDLNGDGYSDLVVGANFTNGDRGRVYIYYGGANPDNVADLMFDDSQGIEGLGVSVSFVGDWNGDGYGDLIVGTEAGKAYIYYGGAQPDTVPDVRLVGTEPHDQFGISVSGAGDVNGDGYADVIVGAPLSNVGAQYAGRADVFFGGPNPNAVPDISLVGDAMFEVHFGLCVAGAGDINRDGHSDLIVGEFRYPDDTNMGRAFVFSATPPGSVDPAPLVIAPVTVSGSEGAALGFTVSATDPDGSPIISLTAAPVPMGATFTESANHGAGSFSWTPNFTQAGAYRVIFTASSSSRMTAATTIRVVNVNRAPSASAGGPYAGTVGIPVAFDGSASSDPDGDALNYSWDFGDGGNAVGVKADHAYASGGTYPVTLTVRDSGAPPLTGTVATTASIVAILDARVFTSGGGNKTIRLGSGKPTWCADIEPVQGDFTVEEIDLSSITLVNGSNHISALTGKTSLGTDSDKNGVPEVEVCFSKDDLRALFADLPSGRQTVSVTVQGTLTNGAHVTGSTNVDVVGDGSTLAASLSPNPFNPSAILTFHTDRPGPVRVRLYAPNGRLVRTLLDLTDIAAGYHDLQVDGRGDNGGRLASGIYFYQIQAAEGQVVGRASLLK